MDANIDRVPSAAFQKGPRSQALPLLLYIITMIPNSPLPSQQSMISLPPLLPRSTSVSCFGAVGFSLGSSVPCLSWEENGERCQKWMTYLDVGRGVAAGPALRCVPPSPTPATPPQSPLPCNIRPKRAEAWRTCPCSRTLELHSPESGTDCCGSCRDQTTPVGSQRLFQTCTDHVAAHRLV